MREFSYKKFNEIRTEAYLSWENILGGVEYFLVAGCSKCTTIPINSLENENATTHHQKTVLPPYLSSCSLTTYIILLALPCLPPPSSPLESSSQRQTPSPPASSSLSPPHLLSRSNTENPHKRIPHTVPPLPRRIGHYTKPPARLPQDPCNNPLSEELLAKHIVTLKHTLGIGHRMSKRGVMDPVRISAMKDARMTSSYSLLGVASDIDEVPGMSSRSVAVATATARSLARRIRAIGL